MTSKIDWCDETWNPLAGCSPVSPGCANCYSARLVATRLKHLPDYAGLVNTNWSSYRPGTSAYRDKPSTYRWTGEVRLLPHKLEQPLHWRKPRRIFVVDKGDLFHEQVPDEYIAAVYGIMAACWWHTFLVLTKRARRMVEWYQWKIQETKAGCVWRGDVSNYLPQPFPPLDGPQTMMPWPLPNVHVGVTCEDQKRADERLAQLEQVPAAVHWLSYEPGLGELRLRDEWLQWLRWVVIGCESGPRARPFKIEWARSLVEQCKEAGVRCFTKQVRWPGYPESIGSRTGKILKSGELVKEGWPAEYPS